MQSMQQIKNGVQRYVDFDLCPGLPELTQILIGGTVALYAERLPAVLEKLQQDPKVAVLDIITPDGVDVDALYSAYAPRMSRPVTMKLPIVGSVTFDRAELEKLYNRINAG